MRVAGRSACAPSRRAARRPRFLDVVARTAPHGFDRTRHAAPGGHHENRQCRIDRLQMVEQLQPFVSGRRVPRVVQVEKRRVEVRLLDGRGDGGGRRDGHDLVPFVGQQKRQRGDDVRLIVGDEDARSLGHRHVCDLFDSLRRLLRRLSCTPSASRVGATSGPISEPLTRSSAA